MNISTAATTLVKSGEGVLKRIVFNSLVASAVTTIYDSLTASGTKIATITSPLTLLNNQAVMEYNAKFSNGLTIVTSATTDITVIYL